MHDALWIQLIQRKVFYEHYLRQKSQLILVHMQCRQKGEAGRSEASKQVQIALQYGLSRQASRLAGGFGGKKHEILLRVASIIISGEFENCFESNSFAEFTKWGLFVFDFDFHHVMSCHELFRICLYTEFVWRELVTCRVNIIEEIWSQHKLLSESIHLPCILRRLDH